MSDFIDQDLYVGNDIFVNGDSVSDTLASKLDLAGGDTITASGASVVPLTIKGASGQTANLLTVEDSAGTDLVVVEPSGNVGIGTSSPAQKLHAVSSQNRILSESIATSDGIFAAKTTVGEWLFGTGIGIAADVFNIFHTTGTVGERLRLDDDGLITGTGRSLGAWTAYTPTWTGATTNPVLGNGTITGAYMRIGKLVICRGTLTAGSTTTFGSGTYFISLPVNAAAASITPQGQGTLFDASGGIYFYLTLDNGDFVGRMTLRLQRIDATYPTLTTVTESLPVTWQQSDVFRWQFIYEAA